MSLLESLASGIAYRYNQLGKPGQSLVKTQYGNREKDHARLAQAAYTQSPVEGYTIDKDLSYGNTTVYKHNQTGKATIAFAGTDTSKTKDILSDIRIGIGAEEQDPQFKQGLRTAKSVIAKYGRDNVDTVGHSLGGAIGHYVSSETGIKSHGFNAPTWGGLFTHATNAGGKKWDYSNTKDSTVAGDIVSSWTNVLPERNVTQIRNETDLKRFKNIFKTKGYEAMANTTIAAEAGIVNPAVGIAVGAGMTGMGIYEIYKSQKGLHSMDNFIQPTRSVASKTQEDRVNAEKDRVRAENPVGHLNHPSETGMRGTIPYRVPKPLAVVPGLPPKPLTYDEQSRVNQPVVLVPGMPTYSTNPIYNYGYASQKKRHNHRQKKTRMTKRRPHSTHR